MFYLFIYQSTFGLFLPVGYYEQCYHKNFYIQAFVFHLLGIYLGVELQGHMVTLGFPGGTSGKESTCQCRRCKRHGFSPWLGRSLEKEMAVHSSILTWEIPWIEEPGGLQSLGSQRVGYN